MDIREFFERQDSKKVKKTNLKELRESVKKDYIKEIFIKAILEENTDEALYSEVSKIVNTLVEDYIDLGNKRDQLFPLNTILKEVKDFDDGDSFTDYFVPYIDAFNSEVNKIVTEDSRVSLQEGVALDAKNKTVNSVIQSIFEAYKKDFYTNSEGLNEIDAIVESVVQTDEELLKLSISNFRTMLVLENLIDEFKIKKKISSFKLEEEVIKPLLALNLISD